MRTIVFAYLGSWHEIIPTHLWIKRIRRLARCTNVLPVRHLSGFRLTTRERPRYACHRNTVSAQPERECRSGECVRKIVTPRPRPPSHNPLFLPPCLPQRLVEVMVDIRQWVPAWVITRQCPTRSSQFSDATPCVQLPKTVQEMKGR